MSAAAKVRSCHLCGCTDDNACLVEDLEGNERPCWWVTIDLCDGCCSKLIRKIRGPIQQRTLRLVGPDRLAICPECGDPYCAGCPPQRDLVKP